ncbi:MAG: cardiolipin synthase [Lachnospiraceae bacterium]|nr:cardiolipin synthase [Lachnospiraceae bacterium]
MERFFNQDAAYEKWARKNGGRDNCFKDNEGESGYLKNLKGRIQNNLSGILRVIVTALIVLIQCVIIIWLPFMLRSFTVYFYFIWELISVIAIVTLVNKNQAPEFRVAWISIVLILPISGFIMYFLWGRSGSKKKKLDEHILHQISYGNQFLVQNEEVYMDFVDKNPISGRMVKYMETEGFPLSAGNDVEYYSMGEEAFEAIFRDLEKAEKFIFIDFFIVAEGGLWDKFYEILKRKISEGVEVKFLYDDFGAAIRTQKYFKQILEHVGVEVRVFNPIHKYTGELYMNYRSHQKIIVIDGEVGYTGGFNLADEYANLIERFGVWKDTGVRVCGDAVWGLTVVFLQMWEASGQVKKHIDYLKYKNIHHYKGNAYCQVISDGPANNPSNPIENVYNQMIMYSDRYLYITTPYLIIEDYMKQSLIEAVQRGVDVRIITPYIPDKKYTKLLTNYNYGVLLRCGVRIYEYTPGFIHAKQILTENAAVIGTINMDYRSFFLHYENGIWISDKEFQENMRKDFMKTFDESKEMTYEEWLNRPRKWKVIQPILNLFATLF